MALGEPASFSAVRVREERQVPPLPSPSPSWHFPPYTRLFYRYQDLAPQLVPLDYTSCPDVKVPYELIGSMPELKVCLAWEKILAMSFAEFL